MTGNLSHLNPVEDNNNCHCLFYLDTNGQFAYINEYCCEYMGYTKEELIAHGLDELGVIADCQNFMSMFKLCLHGKSSRFGTTVRRKDGVTFPAEINITNAPYGHRMLLRCDLHGIGG
jgi:PAS domain S-box-containing protein